MSGYLFVGFFASLWLIMRFRLQIIHVHFAVPAGFLAWILHKVTGLPYVLTTHLGDVPGGVPEKTDRWFRWIYPFTPRIWQDAVSVTAISEHTRRLALSHYPVNTKVIPNGIDMDLIYNTDCKLNVPPQIVFAGRFVPQKNLLLFPQILNWRERVGLALCLDWGWSAKRGDDTTNKRSRFKRSLFFAWLAGS